MVESGKNRIDLVWAHQGPTQSPTQSPQETLECYEDMSYAHRDTLEHRGVTLHRLVAAPSRSQHHQVISVGQSRRWHQCGGKGVRVAKRMYRPKIRLRK